MADDSGILIPGPDGDERGFYDAARRGRLVVQACADCGRYRFPPRPMCPWCNSLGRAWREVAGRGRIWSFVVSHPPLLPAYAELAPYPVVTVELDEDPTIRMVGNVVRAEGAPINSVPPSELAIGRRVQVVFEQITDDITLPRWLLAD
jgi:uncharacterized OB-fold protein